MSYSYVFTIHKPLSKEFEKSSENEFAEMNLLFSSKIDFPDQFRIRNPLRASRGQDRPDSGRVSVRMTWNEDEKRTREQGRSIMEPDLRSFELFNRLAERHWTKTTFRSSSPVFHDKVNKIPIKWSNQE